jgi:membrane-bound lytic murein transglycosylase MltF
VITEFDNLIQQATEQHLPEGYDWRLYKAQLIQESQLNPLAKSSAGAVGLSQMMRGTWTDWAPVAGYKGYKRTDPEASIFTGAVYMNYLIKQWSWPRPNADRYCLAMASYNAGLGNILKAQRIQGNPSLYAEIIPGLKKIPGRRPRATRETIGYVGKILDFCTDLIIGELK